MSAKLDPDVVEVSKAVRQALLELRIYQSTHPVKTARIQSVEALVADGALSPQTIARIANHQIRFHGFPSRIRQDIAVFDVILAGRIPSLHVVGFADGHVEC